MVILDNKLNIVSVNSAFYKIFPIDKQQSIIGRPLSELGNDDWGKPKLYQLLDDVLTKKTWFENYKMKSLLSLIGPHTFLLHAKKLQQKEHKNPLILMVLEDVTERTIFDKRKDDFITITSQKISQPTVKIKAYGNILKESPYVLIDKKTSRLVSDLNSESTKLTVIVDSIRNTSTFLSDTEFPAFSQSKEPVTH